MHIGHLAHKGNFICIIDFCCDRPTKQCAEAYRTTRRQLIFKKSWNYYTSLVH